MKFQICKKANTPLNLVSLAMFSIAVLAASDAFAQSGKARAGRQEYSWQTSYAQPTPQGGNKEIRIV